MKDLRLIPIVLVAVSGLLLLKLLGFATGEVLPGGHGLTVGTARAAEGDAAPTAADAPADPGEAAAPPEGAAKADPAAAEAADPAAGEGEGEAAASPLPANVTTERPEETRFESGDTAEERLLQRLGERRVELDRREEEIRMRAKLLEAAEARLGQRVEELKALETRIGVSAEMKKAEDDARLKGLVTMYETMKPKDAARVFDQLDFAVLLPLVRQMNPKKMAIILAAMQPEVAGRLTAAIAERDALTGGAPVAAPVAGAAPSIDQLPKIGPAATP